MEINTKEEWTTADEILESVGLSESNLLNESEEQPELLSESLELFAGMALASGIKNWTMEKLARVNKEAALTSAAIWCKKLNITVGFRAVKREGVWEIDFRRDLNIAKDRGFFKRLLAAFFMKSVFATGPKPSFPFKMGVVDGNMYISDMNVRTMYNFPREVRGDLDISSNSLVSLKKFPMKVSGRADLSHNKIGFDKKKPMFLSDDKGRPIKIIYGSLDLSSNHIKDFTDFPVTTINGDFDISNNPYLTSYNAKDLENIGGEFDCSFNENLVSITEWPKDIVGDVDFSGRAEVVGKDKHESQSKIAKYFVNDWRALGLESGVVGTNPFNDPAIEIGGILKLIGIVPNDSYVLDNLKKVSHKIVTTGSSHKIGRSKEDSGIDPKKLDKENFVDNFQSQAQRKLQYLEPKNNLISNIWDIAKKNNITTKQKAQWLDGGANVFVLPKAGSVTRTPRRFYGFKTISKPAPWAVLIIASVVDQKMYVMVTPLDDNNKTVVSQVSQNGLDLSNIKMIYAYDEKTYDALLDNLSMEEKDLDKWLEANGLLQKDNKAKKDTAEPDAQDKEQAKTEPKKIEPITPVKTKVEPDTKPQADLTPDTRNKQPPKPLNNSFSTDWLDYVL